MGGNSSTGKNYNFIYVIDVSIICRPVTDSGGGRDGSLRRVDGRAYTSVTVPLRDVTRRES
jgi:hypothetical protein